MVETLTSKLAGEKRSHRFSKWEVCAGRHCIIRVPNTASVPTEFLTHVIEGLGPSGAVGGSCGATCAWDGGSLASASVSLPWSKLKTRGAGVGTLAPCRESFTMLVEGIWGTSAQSSSSVPVYISVAAPSMRANHVVHERHSSSQGANTQFDTVVALTASESFAGMGVAETNHADEVTVHTHCKCKMYV